MKDKYLAVIAFPLIFMPALLTALLNDIIVKPTIWWGFHAIYAVSCLLSIGLLLIILRVSGHNIRDIGLVDFRISHVGWAFVFFIIAFIVWGIVDYLLKGLGIVNQWGMEIIFTQSYEILILFIYAVIAGPLAEELLFRGYFITFVGKIISPNLAAFVSILLFAIYHFLGFGLAGSILILFWVPFPTLLFLWKKSLYPGLMMHAINNFVVYIIFGLLASSVIR